MNTPPEPPDDGDLDIQVDGHILHIRGEIDAHSAPALGEAVSAASGSVELDLSAVGFVDSSGLRVLIEMHQMLDERGDVLTIANPTAPVQRMFELSAVDEYLNLVHR